MAYNKANRKIYNKLAVFTRFKGEFWACRQGKLTVLLYYIPCKEEDIRAADIIRAPRGPAIFLPGSGPNYTLDNRWL